MVGVGCCNHYSSIHALSSIENKMKDMHISKDIWIVGGDDFNQHQHQHVCERTQNITCTSTNYGWIIPLVEIRSSNAG